MKATRRRRLESAGWRVGSSEAFLHLSRAEAELVETKLALSESLRMHRQKRGLTQTLLARRLGSSQSRVAKLESAAAGATLDLLFRALLATGVSRAEIARVLARRRRIRAA